MNNYVTYRPRHPGEHTTHAARIGSEADSRGRVIAMCNRKVYEVDTERFEEQEDGLSGLVTCPECRPSAESIRPIQNGEKQIAESLYGTGTALSVVY